MKLSSIYVLRPRGGAAIKGFFFMQDFINCIDQIIIIKRTVKNGQALFFNDINLLKRGITLVLRGNKDEGKGGVFGKFLSGLPQSDTINNGQIDVCNHDVGLLLVKQHIHGLLTVTE